MPSIAFTPALLCDILLLLFLLYCVISGAKRGLVLTLCGLIAVVVAFIGASFVADLATPVVSPMVEPQVTVFIEEQLTDYFQEHNMADSATLSDGQVAELLEAIGFSDVTVSSDAGQAFSAGITDLATRAAASVSYTLVYCVIFLLSFVVLLILWTILSHALNLVTYLPVLHSLNGLGGGVLGLFKGCFILFVCAFALKYLGGFVLGDLVNETILVSFFMTTNPVALALHSATLLAS